MFEKKAKAETPKRLERTASESFGELDTTVLIDTQTGVNYMVVRNNLTGGIAVTPMYSADNEVLVTDIPDGK